MPTRRRLGSVTRTTPMRVWDCQRVKDLEDKIRGNTLRASEKANIGAHTKQCPTCRVLVASWRDEPPPDDAA